MGDLSLVLHLLSSFFCFFNTLDNKVCCGILDSVLFFHRELIYFLLSLFQHHSLAELRLQTPFLCSQALSSFLVEVLFCFGCAGSALWLVGLSLAVVHRFSFPVACGILVPGLVIEPESAVLGGGFFSTGPPEKSLVKLF